MSPTRSPAAWLAMLAAAVGAPAQAFTVGIAPGLRLLYLQVGAGTMFPGTSGGTTYSTGGFPTNNTTINSASVSVPAATLGRGVAQPMTTDSTVTASPYDNVPYCSAPASTGQVYVGGYYRESSGGSGSAAMLAVSTPANLSSARGDTIAFNRIAWTSSGSRDATPTIPSGAFTGGAQNLLPIARNTWFESCLAFRYLNTQVIPAGTFTGQATFTLAAP